MYCNLKSLFSLATTAAILSLANTAQAATLNVPSSSYRSIQAAINAASPGDTIAIASGIYYGEITWANKNLTIRGAGAASTILDARPTQYYTQWGTRCLTVSGVPSTSRIEGITFLNGRGGGGGAMYLENSSPAIVNCTFRDNSSAFGGALFLRSSSNPALIGCTFSGNTAARGGGIYNEGASPRITNCTFSNQSTAVGGAIYNTNGGRPTLVNCNLSFNVAQGGQILGGGALYNSPTSQATLINCTLAYNTANYGGAIQNEGDSVSLTNCIVWGNVAHYGFPVFQGNVTATYSDVQGGWSGVGNLNADPLFVSFADKNLRLQAASPCRDRGTNSVVTPALFPAISGVLVDIEGKARIQYGTVSLGAYEEGLPVDITSAVSITKGQIQANGTNKYKQVVTIRYTGNSTISGPISLVLGGLTNYTVSNADGVTSAVAPTGRPYIELTDNLAPGTAIAVVVQFTRTSGSGTPSWTAQVVAGDRL